MRKSIGTVRSYPHGDRRTGSGRTKLSSVFLSFSGGVIDLNLHLVIGEAKLVVTIFGVGIGVIGPCISFWSPKKSLYVVTDVHVRINYNAKLVKNEHLSLISVFAMNCTAAEAGAAVLE